MPRNVWDEITYPLLKLQQLHSWSLRMESNFISHITNAITYSRWDQLHNWHLLLSPFIEISCYNYNQQSTGNYINSLSWTKWLAFHRKYFNWIIGKILFCFKFNTWLAQFDDQDASNPCWGVTTTRSAAVTPWQPHPLSRPSSYSSSLVESCTAVQYDMILHVTATMVKQKVLGQFNTLMSFQKYTGIPFIKIRWSHDHLILITRIPISIPGKMVSILKQWRQGSCFSSL